RGVTGRGPSVEQPPLELFECLGELALDVLVAVEAQLGVTPEVRAELDEERTEVLIHAVEVVVVDHGGRFLQPGIAATGAWVLLGDGTDNGRSFLGLADKENPFAGAELGEVFARDFVLALPPAKSDQVKALRLGELFDGSDKGPRDFRHCLGGGELLAAMLAKEISDAAFDLQAWLNDIQIQAVEALDGECHVALDDIGNGSR